MQITLQPADTPTDDPHDVIAAQLRDLAPRLASPDGQVAAGPEPATELSSIHAPLNDNIGGATARAPGAGWRAGAARLVLIASAGCAAAAGWYVYGQAAKQTFSNLVPQFLIGAPVPGHEQHDAASPSTNPQQVIASASAPEAGAAPPVTPAEPATAATAQAVDAPAAQAELSLELAKSIETMTREIASLKETVEQLQAGQRQLSRDIGKAAEQAAQHKAAQSAKAAAPPRPQPSTAAVRRPFAPPTAQTNSQVQPYPPAVQRDAYIPPPAPLQQLPPQPGDTSVPRPPMPLR